MIDPLLYEERNAALRGVYESIIRSYGVVNMRYMSRAVILELIMEHSAPRFYITPELAGWYICQYERWGRLVVVKSHKREMLLDLISVYERLRKEHPYMKRGELYDLVVNQPAKSFYMRKQRIKEVIFRYSGRNEKK